MTARAELVAALQRAGYGEGAARELLGRAQREPRDPHTEFRATLDGGHALITEFGDEEIYGSCQCGSRFGVITPDMSLDTFATPWERHVMTEVEDP